MNTKKVREESESSDAECQASDSGRSSAKQGQYSVGYIVKIVLYLSSLAVPPLLFEVSFLDWFKIWFLILFVWIFIHLADTRRGGVCSAIQQFSVIGGWGLGFWVGLEIIGTTVFGGVFGIILGLSLGFGLFIALDWLYEWMGISKYERR